MNPEEVVEAYLDVALNMTHVNQRTLLIRYTTGELREAIAQVSDDIIKQAYIDKNFVVEAFSILEYRERTPREIEITFVLMCLQTPVQLN